MTSIAIKHLPMVSGRGAAPASGTASVSGATSRGDLGAVNLTVTRVGSGKATLMGGVSALDDGRTSLEMTRKGKVTSVVGRIGFRDARVALEVVQETPDKSTINGAFMGRTISLTVARDPKQPGVALVTGKLFPYEEPAIGTVSITIRDVDGLRSYEGGTSKKPEGRVQLQESRQGDVIKTTGKLGGWYVTELSQPANFHSLELFDTTLLVVMAQAIRRFNEL